jgi:hypothetical protein
MGVKIEKRVVEVAIETTSDVAVLDGTNAQELVVALNDLRAAAKKIKEEKERVEAEIRALLGEATSGLIDGVERVYLQSITREGVDKEALAADFPEAWTATRTSTTYTVVKTK